MKEFLYILCAAAFLTLGFFIGRGARPDTPEPEIIVRIDTVFKEKPVETSSIPAGYELVPVGAIDALSGEVNELKDSLFRKPSIIVKDSLVYVEVPMESKVYEDSTFRAQVSGYRPSLDWIETYNKTITKIEKIPPKRIGFDFTVGPGILYDGKMHGGIGIVGGVSWRF